MALTCPHLPTSSGTDTDQPPALQGPRADWVDGPGSVAPRVRVSSLGPGRTLTPETAVLRLLLLTLRVTAPPDLGKARLGEGKDVREGQKARQGCSAPSAPPLPVSKESRGAWLALVGGRLTLPRCPSAVWGRTGSECVSV